MTPLSMQVASGQQLLRIVRDGYLENRQIVSLDAGDTRTVSVVLTLAEATQPVEEAGGGGRLVYILGAVGGGVAAAVALGVSGGDSTGDGVVIAPPRTETRNGQVAGNAPGVPRMVEYAFTTRNGSPDIKVGRSPGRSDQELCDLGRNRLIHGFFWDLPEQYSLASVDGRLRRPRSGWGACSAAAKSRRKVFNLWLLLDDRWAGDTAQVEPVR